MRVLVIEDSERLRRSVVAGLRQAGFTIDDAGTGAAGLELAAVHDYDAVVLDLGLPDTDGLRVLERLRAGGRPLPVLILSARDTVEDRVGGLRTGADDYLVKPFAFAELVARLQAMTRRHYRQPRPTIELGPLTIDTAARTVSRAGKPIALPPREYALLELLVRNRGRVVSRTEIEEHIYDERVAPMSNVVDAAVSSLRRTLARRGEPGLITTRRGLGYIIA